MKDVLMFAATGEKLRLMFAWDFLAQSYGRVPASLFTKSCVGKTLPSVTRTLDIPADSLLKKDLLKQLDKNDEHVTMFD